ncbi:MULTISPECIES: NADH-quinone oxidoreductase subunit M [Mycobacteroides]|uniref:NADH-quinone oxidoreductase subunit M n=1 Tax=Mycobacteroides TaxID=670516 RepID=UPI00096AAFED|nr:MULTISPECIES: NADH-quinone oxidoreductase subunit M [Mycobacteroides]MBV6361504.1 NADH-quinone oxidoreductase subunit M [Mycobacteroides chelonae]MEC4837831.1 NADH-quinone oxidoreductase subunit M [Mycobacteroides chelonae]MEC4858113.1 NADH-quinone oxidoreductase subunit M [Mycobacteroides chelonae]MEC4870844.1 NADH-quinone oxidoreductase subunit M [Mycobacteroides chelonae]MEC4904783.1 NADH-quinone oxidoreductase subunit M [Mycobacteroides chelonae]
MVSAVGAVTALWFIPLIGAATVLIMPGRRRTLAKYVALSASLLVLVVAIGLAIAFDPAGPQYQFVESMSWIPAFGMKYAVGLDGIALALVLLTAGLLPVLLLAGWNDGAEAPGYGNRPLAQRYVALILIVESMVLLSFSALDVLLFYIFFEAMLIPMYFLIGGFGSTHSDAKQRSRAAVKFLMYNLFGGLIMLAAVIGLYVVTARGQTGTFDLRDITEMVATGALGIDPGVAKALFLGFMFAFAVKAPLWPFHTWLPDAAVHATPASAVLMMAIVDKVGTFAMLRYCIQLFPEASRYFTPVIITLAVIGIVYGAIVAIGQTDVMRLIAYTSISHFGFIILGIFAMTSQGQSGSTLYMVNHGISTAALMLVAGFLVSRKGSRLIAAYGGVQKVAPVLAGSFLVAGLATLSLPGLAPFISEFLVLVGTFTRYPAAAACAVIALVLAAIYVLWMYQRMMTGPLAPGNESIGDLKRRELTVVAPLIAMLLVLGIYPKPLLDIVNPAVEQTLRNVNEKDPPPAVADIALRHGEGERR